MGFFFDVPYRLHVCLAVLPILVLSLWTLSTRVDVATQSNHLGLQLISHTHTDMHTFSFSIMNMQYVQYMCTSFKELEYIYTYFWKNIVVDSLLFFFAACSMWKVRSPHNGKWLCCTLPNGGLSTRRCNRGPRALTEPMVNCYPENYHDWLENPPWMKMYFLLNIGIFHDFTMSCNKSMVLWMDDTSCYIL